MDKTIDSNKLHVENYLTVPGAEVTISTGECGAMRIEKLAAILMRLAAQNPDRRVKFWIQLGE